MTSKAAKRRAKKARITLPGGAEVTQRPTGRDRRHTNQPEDARREALEARLRVSGICPTAEAIKAAVAPAFGHDVGLCINTILKGDEATKAWDTFTHLCASHRNYQMLYVGQTGSPQCAAIAMIPEPMETDPSLRVDLRTHDEKVRAAKASWAAWEAKIAALPFPQFRMAVNGVLRGFLGDGTLWRDGKPTDTGRTVVAAIRAMEA